MLETKKDETKTQKSVIKISIIKTIKEKRRSKRKFLIALLLDAISLRILLAFSLLL